MFTEKLRECIEYFMKRRVLKEILENPRDFVDKKTKRNKDT